MIKLKKNTLVGKINFFLFFISFLVYTITSNSQNSVLEGNYLDIKVLDKVSSKSYELKVKILEEKIFKNISIKDKSTFFFFEITSSKFIKIGF